MKAFAIAVLFGAAALVNGCGGGSRLYSEHGGEVESGEIVFDSLPKQPAENEYVIGYGDALDVVFPFERAWSVTDIKVRPDGRISLPHAGEIRAAGMTVAGLDSVLGARYSDIFVNPSVTVIVRTFQQQVVYVLGEVATGGGFPYQQGMTLMQVLALGRGPTMAGQKTGVIVIRRVASDRIVGFQIDVREITENHRFDLDIPLKPFDIVYVPKSRLSRASDFVKIVYDIILNPVDLYLRGWQVANVKVLYEFYRRSGTAL